MRATDISLIAVERERERCAQYPGVSVSHAGLLPDRDEIFDLVVFSEIGYYLEVPHLEESVTALSSCVVTGGRFIAVHWIGNSPDHVLSWHDVHRILGNIFAEWVHRFHHEHHDDRRDGYVIDVWDLP